MLPGYFWKLPYRVYQHIGYSDTRMHSGTTRNISPNFLFFIQINLLIKILWGYPWGTSWTRENVYIHTHESTTTPSFFSPHYFSPRVPKRGWYCSAASNWSCNWSREPGSYLWCIFHVFYHLVSVLNLSYFHIIIVSNITLVFIMHIQMYPCMCVFEELTYRGFCIRIAVSVQLSLPWRLDRGVTNKEFSLLFDECEVMNVITTMLDYYAVSISLKNLSKNRNGPPVQQGFSLPASISVISFCSKWQCYSLLESV